MKKKKQDNDFLANEAKEEQQTAPEYTLDIPDDEIWTYRFYIAVGSFDLSK